MLPLRFNLELEKCEKVCKSWGARRSPIVLEPFVFLAEREGEGELPKKKGEASLRALVSNDSCEEQPNPLDDGNCAGGSERRQVERASRGLPIAALAAARC